MYNLFTREIFSCFLKNVDVYSALLCTPTHTHTPTHPPTHMHTCRCNRYKEQAEARLEVEKARKGIMDDYVKNAQETQVKSLEKFKHYYSRYDNHLNSLEVCVVLYICIHE